MRLGEMLVRDNRISPQQLDNALAYQHKAGGRLGSILVEMGHIDAESLSVYLGLELGIPIATGATFERCKRSAVRLLNPEQAARLRCIPIVIQGQTLIVAVDDPHDMWVLDEISSITGYRVLPRVAPEIRIFYYLERFYGVPRPPRWARLGDALRGTKDPLAQSSLPAPPLPGLPPRTAEPVQPPNPAPVLHIDDDDEDDDDEELAEPAPKRQSAQTLEAIEIDAADLIEVLDDDEAETASEAPPTEEISIVDRSRPRVPTADYEPIELSEALTQMASCSTRGAIADVLLQYASSIFEVSCLFMIRDAMAFGWKGFGPAVAPDRIEALLIPLNAPSMLQVARHTDGMFRDRAFPATLHSYLFKVLRCTTPACSIVVEVKIGPRPVNMLYGHRADGQDLDYSQLQGLQEVAEATADAYVRLITVAKEKAKSHTG